jgi:hypothetical protein
VLASASGLAAVVGRCTSGMWRAWSRRLPTQSPADVHRIFSGAMPFVRMSAQVIARRRWRSDRVHPDTVAKGVPALDRDGGPVEAGTGTGR